MNYHLSGSKKGGDRKVTTKNTERDRVLSQDEIKLLNEQLPAAGLMRPTQAAIWIMLSTLFRVGELSKAQ